MKCQKCSKAATMHITEVLGEEQFEEHHLCEECAQKYLYEPPKKGGVLNALRRSPLVGADLNVTRSVADDRKVRL